VNVTLADGYRLFVEEVGAGFPLVVLHGGPGMDHTMFRPYIDPLGEHYRVLYVDQRGQGRSDRVDPRGLSIDVFARDVDLLAAALGLRAFALLGHSFGAIVATHHAIEYGTAAAYVISGGADAAEPLMQDVEASLAAMGEAGRPIAESWEQETTVETDEQMTELLRTQMPFHFHGPPPPGYGDDTVFSAEVLRHFASAGYGGFDYRSGLDAVRKPTLVIVGEHDRTTTPRAARVLHAGIAGSELHVVAGAGHMSFVERAEDYLPVVQHFLNSATVGGMRGRGYTGSRSHDE
jgi:proline iminopeptidase